MSIVITNTLFLIAVAVVGYALWISRAYVQLSRRTSALKADYDELLATRSAQISDTGQEQLGEEEPEAPALTAEEEWQLRLDALVREHIDDFHFNIDRLAEHMGVNRKTLYRRVRAGTGMSVNQYINEVRLITARELLATGRVSNLRELAEAVGMRSPNYLSRLYRERFGHAPGDSIPPYPPERSYF